MTRIEDRDSDSLVEFYRGYIDLSEPGRKLSGFSAREGLRSLGEVDRDFYRSIRLRDPSGAGLTLGSCPNLSTPESWTDFLDDLSKHTVAIGGTHNHSGFSIGHASNADATFDLQEKILAASFSDFDGQSVRVARLSVLDEYVGVSRRYPLPGGGFDLKPYPEGDRRGYVDVLAMAVLVDGEWQVRGGIVFLPCHSTGLGGSNLYCSGDLAGALSRFLEQHTSYDKSCWIVAMSGGGDQCPVKRGAERATYPNSYISLAHSLYESIAQEFSEIDYDETQELSLFASQRSRIDLPQRGDGYPSNPNFTMQAMRLTEGSNDRKPLVMLMYSGECFNVIAVEIIERAAAELGVDVVLADKYLGNNGGYIVTEECLAETDEPLSYEHGACDHGPGGRAVFVEAGLGHVATAAGIERRAA